MEEGLDPADVLKPLSDSWPTYSGDNTGRRYSSLTQINQTTVKNLTLAWTSAADGRIRRRRLAVSAAAVAAAAAPIIIGGEGTEEVGGAPSVKGAILQVNGVLYVTAPDNVWALDARDGRELWRYFWKTTRRHAHRQSRRGDVAQLPVLRDARQLPRLARRADRQGTLARRDRRLRSAVLLDDGADRHRQPRARRHRQRPRRARDSCSPTIRKPASGSGSSTPCR